HGKPERLQEMIGEGLAPIEKPAGQHVSVEEIEQGTYERRQSVPDLVTQPTLALRLGAEQSCIDLAVVGRRAQLEQFPGLPRRVRVVLGDPVPNSPPVLMDEVMPKASGGAVDDQMLVDRAIF